MITIKCDIDGVLRDFDGAVYKAIKRHYPKAAPPRRPIITNWHTHLFYPMFEKSHFYSFVFNEAAYEIFTNAKPYPGAIKFIRELKKFGNLILVTHQNEITAKATIDWLKEHKIKYDFLCISKDCNKEIINGDLLIDDKPENVEQNLKNILFHRPWNNIFASSWHNVAYNYEDVINHIRSSY